MILRDLSPDIAHALEKPVEETQQQQQQHAPESERRSERVTWSSTIMQDSVRWPPMVGVLQICNQRR